MDASREDVRWEVWFRLAATGAQALGRRKSPARVMLSGLLWPPRNVSNIKPSVLLGNEQDRL